jgi:hypothetical protein
MGEIIDGNAAFEADTHSTEWTAGLAGNGAPKTCFARDQDSSGHSGALRDAHCFSVYEEVDGLTRGLHTSSLASMARKELRSRDAARCRREVWPSPERL